MTMAGLFGLALLPDEVLLHIISYLTPSDNTNLQLVSRHLKNLSRDNKSWKSRCFEDSSYLENLRFRQTLYRNDYDARSNLDSGSGSDSPGCGDEVALHSQAEKTRILANWDPSYPTEQVCWYDEYIQRYGPVTVNWLQQPTVQEGSVMHHVEARGVALYYPDGPSHSELGQETVLAVSPLDDGSVCLWDVNGTRGRKKRGAILGRSEPGILFIDGPESDNTRRSKRVDSGVTECVSVDSYRHCAFFAIQSHLIKVDLQAMAVVDCSSFPWSITTLSAAHHSVPLTVGTSLGIHLHDYRAHFRFEGDVVEKLDDFGLRGANAFYERSVRDLFDEKPLPPMASLSQPGPLNILHMPHAGSDTMLSDDIYVAGRFSNILHYDRRKFQAIKGSIFSGARLCSLASIPYPFSALDSELRRKGQLSKEQVKRGKSTEGGRTLVACGEYGTKGSLELYGLAATPLSDVPGGLQSAAFKNRQSTASSKLLSVVNHGTKIAFSDGSGYITWFERDGFTEIRRCKIGNSEDRAEEPSLFASMPGSDDLARKLLPTRQGLASGRVNDNDLLFWTGEKLGLLTFSARPGFTADMFEDGPGLSAEEVERLKQELAYKEGMQRALEQQADDARLVRILC